MPWGQINLQHIAKNSPLSGTAPQGRKPASPEGTAAERIYETLLGPVPTHRNLL